MTKYETVGPSVVAVWHKVRHEEWTHVPGEPCNVKGCTAERLAMARRTAETLYGKRERG
jgi:hypothetical protein